MNAKEPKSKTGCVVSCCDWKANLTSIDAYWEDVIQGKSAYALWPHITLYRKHIPIDDGGVKAKNKETKKEKAREKKS